MAHTVAMGHGKRVNAGKTRDKSEERNTNTPSIERRRGDDPLELPSDAEGEGYELLRTGDVAQTFGVDVSTIRRWCTTLGFPCILLPSGERRFDPKQLAKWWRDIKAAHELK